MKSIQKYWTKISITYVLLLGCLVMLLTPKSVAAEHVLILNSYHPQYIWSSEQISGIEDVLKEEIPLENIHVEYLDSRRFIDDKRYAQYLLDLIDYKYKKRYDISLIMVNEDFALNFALENRDSIFKGIPIVFSGINADFSAMLEQHKNVTGIYEGIDIKGNIALIRRVQPEVKKIALITDTTHLGQNARQQALKVIAGLKNEKHYHGIEFDIWDDYSYRELRGRLEKLPDNSAGLMLIVQQDNNGRYFSYQKDLQALSEASSSPLYGLWGSLVLGNGVIGGNMLSPYVHGQNAAYMARKILQGRPAYDIPIIHMADYSPHFDYQVLQRFDIDMHTLPDGSTVINAPLKNYDRLLKIFTITCAIAVLLLIFSLVMLLNIKRRKQAESRLHSLAYNDELTSLPNKNSFIKYVYKIEKRAPEQYIVALVDIAGFRYINEKLGYEAGNLLLQNVAERLSVMLPNYSFLGRFGADEFYIVCDTKCEITKDKLATTVKKIFDQPFLFEYQKIILRINTGILNFPVDAQTASQLINYLEAAKNEAKKRKDVSVVYFDKALPEKWRHRTMVETKILDALAEDKFFMVYQPKVSITKNTVVGAEGLIRMRGDDEGSIIYPNDFIEVAEKSYLIQKINLSVIDNVIKDMNCWYAKGIHLVPISINLSSFSLYQSELVEYLEATMAVNPHLKGLFQIELTESVLIDDLNTARNCLQTLNNIGISIAIDDFGTGWSNLSYLKELPIGDLKIDRSLVCDITDNEKSRNILAAIQSLVKNTDTSTVVEGVETPQQLNVLDELGYDIVQGYIYYKPMFSVKLQQLLSSRYRSIPVYTKNKVLMLADAPQFKSLAIAPA